MKSAKQECKIKQSKYKNKLNNIGQYYYANTGLSPPKNTYNSKLRSNYNWIRAYEHCNTIGLWEQPDYADPNRIIRLIYWQNIIRNFEKNIGELNNSSYNDLAISLFGVGLPDLTEESRSAIFHRVMQLDNQMYNYQEREYSHASNALKSYIWKLKKLVELDPNVIPLNWATETDSDALLLSFNEPSNQLFH